VRAHACVVAVADGRGGTRLERLTGSGPLLPRRTGPSRVHLVAGAAGPLSGDELSLDIDVGPGATLELRTVAAMVVLPGPVANRPSQVDVRASVAERATLVLLPEPTVLTARAWHLGTSTFAVADGGRLTVREELILGRTRESGGRLRARTVLDVAGAPALRHTLDLDGGPEVAGPAVLAGARAVGHLLLVGGEPPPAGLLGPTAAVLPLAVLGATLVTALAGDAAQLRGYLELALRSGDGRADAG
jgi:urease accessory protein